MSKKNVLHVLWWGRTGGAEVFVKNIVQYSDKEKFVHHICFLSEGGPLADQMKELGAPIYILGMKNGLSFIAGFKFFSLLHKIKPEVLHNHTRNYFTNILSLMKKGLVRVYSEHGGSYDPKVSPKEVRRFNQFYRFFMRFYSIILTPADYLKDMILQASQCSEEKVEIYRYGIMPDRYGPGSNNGQLRKELNIPSEKKVVGIVARLVEQKGIDDFIKIAALVKESYKNCEFVVVGDGPLRGSLEQFAQEKNVDIKFLGDRQDLTNILNSLDVYLFTSRWEPFGIIVPEALASEIPVVGFAVPGNRSIIEGGGGGILVEDRDHQKMADAVIDILRNEEKRKQLTKEGLENVRKNYDVQKNVRRLDSKYLSLV